MVGDKIELREVQLLYNIAESRVADILYARVQQFVEETEPERILDMSDSQVVDAFVSFYGR